MTPTVLLEYTKEKQMKRSYDELLVTTKVPNGYSPGFVADHPHAAERMGESEGIGSPVHVDSEDSSAPKRKCISLNSDSCDGFKIPMQVISLSKLSASERKSYETRLRLELEQIQALKKKILPVSVGAVSSIALSSSASGNWKKQGAVGQNRSQAKQGVKERLEYPKINTPPAYGCTSDTMVMKQCEALLKKLMAQKYGWIFNNPVDVVKLNIPDYFDIIKHPMDLGTIKRKITSGAYTSPCGFAADVRLTFTNAMTYNPPGNDVHLIADTMSKMFEARWKPIEKKLVASDVPIKKKIEVAKPGPHLKKREPIQVNHDVITTEILKPGVTPEEKQNIATRLMSFSEDLPAEIAEFLQKCSNSVYQNGEEELEIEIDSLTDDMLFELQKLLDTYLVVKKKDEQSKAEQCEMEVLNMSGISNTSILPCKGNELVEDDVDICGNVPPISSYPPVLIEKDARARSGKCSSSNSSSTDSGSSTSDSDSDSSSGSESQERGASPMQNSKDIARAEMPAYQAKSDVISSLDVNRSVSEMDLEEQENHSKPKSLEANLHVEGENAKPERQVSPDKLYRAALLRSRFADTIVKAREKLLTQGEKGDPEKLRREREELEKQQREEKERLLAEAKAAEDARRRAEAEAEAENKRKRELEREAARQALLKMEKTVEINDTIVLRDLEMLRAAPAEHIVSSVDETSPEHSPDGMAGFLPSGCNPLERLGLYMKVDLDEEEEDDGQPSRASAKDAEEGEID